MKDSPYVTTFDHSCKLLAAACLLLALPLSGQPLSGQTGAPAPALPTGTVIEKISCQEAPDQQYALYLPSSYRADRAWPILYALDARGNGAEVAELLKAGAEQYGWIVASSYNSQSDVRVDPNIAAVRALWVDTHARLAIDDRRIYLAGYSGTVRSAMKVALAAPGTVTGIFGASAGFPFERPPTKDVTFDFFGTVGDSDMNYYEMMDLEKKLAALALPFRIEVFVGPHAWPPADLAARGMGWLELRAMQRGLRPRDAAIIDALWAQDLEQARRAEAAGRIADAFHTWSALKTSYAGLRDTAEAERKVAELGGSAALRREIAAREERMERDKAYLAEAPRILGRAINADPEGPPATAARIAHELAVSEWQKRAASADVEESLAARRVINTLMAQTNSYLPTMLLERKDYDTAALMFSVAAEIRPESPAPWLGIAAAHARKGKAGRKRALEALDKAVALGFANRAWIDGEAAFDGLRQDERFREILAKMAPASGDSRR